MPAPKGTSLQGICFLEDNLRWNLLLCSAPSFRPRLKSFALAPPSPRDLDLACSSRTGFCGFSSSSDVFLSRDFVLQTTKLCLAHTGNFVSLDAGWDSGKGKGGVKICVCFWGRAGEETTIVFCGLGELKIVFFFRGRGRDGGLRLFSWGFMSNGLGDLMDFDFWLLMFT